MPQPGDCYVHSYYTISWPFRASAGVTWKLAEEKLVYLQQINEETSEVLLLCCGQPRVIVVPTEALSSSKLEEF